MQVHGTGQLIDVLQPGAHHSFKTPKTYSNKNKPKGSPTSRRSDTVAPLPYTTEPRGVKRQKISHEVVDLDGEHTSWKSTSPERSRGGAGRPPVNEFEATNAMVQPRRKQVRDSTVPGASLGHRGSPIVLDEEAAPEATNSARRLQLTTFEQGIPQKTNGSAKVRSGDTVSPHWSKGNDPKVHKSQKQRDPRGFTHTDNSVNLRGQFKRSTHVDPVSDSGSEDELAAAPTVITKTPFTLQKTFGKHGSNKIAGLPPGGWHLKWARTHTFEEHGPGLTLNRGASMQGWRVVGVNAEGVRVTKSNFSFDGINFIKSDGTSRIRLRGPKDANSFQYFLDMEFADHECFQTFRKECRNTEILMHTATEEFMQSIFSKPLDSNHGDQPSTMHQKAQSGPKLEPSNAEKPRKTGVLSALHEGHEQHAKKNSALVNASNTGAQNASMVRTSIRQTRATRASAPDYVAIDAEPDRPAGYSVTVGLGVPWKRQLTYGTGRHRAVIDFNDLTRLDEEQFLNDSLIDFYMTYLLNHSNIPANKVYIFNTHFFSTLTRKVPGSNKRTINYAGVERWTAKQDIFDHDYIVVPINQDLHWYLAIICNVRNIVRSSVIDDSEEPPVSSEATSKMPTAQLLRSDNAASTLTSAPTPEIGDSDQTHPSEDEMLYPGESELDLVDPHVIRESTEPITKSERVIAETVQHNQHDMTNANAAELPSLKAASSSFSKKSKRKSGPPPRKCDPREPCIIIMDSLGNTSRSGAVRALKDYIVEEGRAKRGIEVAINQNAIYPKSNEIPMQDNFSDCGVYVLGYIQEFFKNPDGFMDCLLHREMSAERDWSDMSVNKMRGDMRNILMDLHKEQNNEQKRARMAQKAVSSAANNSSGAPANDRSKQHMQENEEFPTPNFGLGEQESSNQLRQTVSEPVMGSRSGIEDSSRPSKGSAMKAASTARPRLGSPFEARPVVKSSPASAARVRSPETTRHEKHGVPDQPPSSERSTRKSSPKVLIPSSPSVCSSAKRKRDDVLPDLEVASPPRLDQTAGEVKPAPTTNETSVKPPRKKMKSMTSMQNTEAGVRGSSNDPISIDDSQDTIVCKLRSTPYKEDDPDMVIVLSPNGSQRTKTVGMHPDFSPPGNKQTRARSPTTRADKGEILEVPDSPDEQTKSPPVPKKIILPI